MADANGTPGLPNSLQINDTEFTRVTHKTTPKQFVDDRFDNDAFAGNDNNRRLIGKKITDAVRAGEGSLSELAENNSGDGSVVHKSNLEAAKQYAASQGVTPEAQTTRLSDAFPESGEGKIPVPAVDPNVKPGNGATPPAGGTAAPAGSAPGWTAQS